MAVSKTAFTLLVTMDMVLLLISICLHCFGVYLLLFRRKTRKNQHVILIHLSVSEILVSGFRTVTLVYFHQYEKQEELLVYQVLRTITIQGWCVSYVLIMIAVAVDPLLMIVLKTKYNRLVSRRRLNITLASCWVVGVLYGAVSFTQDYKTREEIAAKYTFPIICACFLLFAGGAYCVIYISVRKGYKQMRRRTLTHTNNRTVKFRVPVLIILTFIVFVALPSGIQSAIKAEIEKSHLIALAILYSTAFVLDALIYLFLQPTTRRLIFTKTNQARIHVEGSSRMPSVVGHRVYDLPRSSVV